MGRKAAEESVELRKDYVRIDGKSDQVQFGAASKRGDVELIMAGIRFQLSRGVAEELLGGLTRQIRPYAGYSIFDRIMEELDTVIDRLMSGDGAAADERDPGRAEAFCRALAMIRDPYQPDYEEERKRQMERWNQRNGVSE
jgi:hypothetical protein